MTSISILKVKAFFFDLVFHYDLVCVVNKLTYVTKKSVTIPVLKGDIVVFLIFLISNKLETKAYPEDTTIFKRHEINWEILKNRNSPNKAYISFYPFMRTHVVKIKTKVY